MCYTCRFYIKEKLIILEEENKINVNKAKAVAKVINRIEKCESFLNSLEGRSYNDEFAIYYKGFETCELEVAALKILIKYYEDELVVLNEELKNL